MIRRPWPWRSVGAALVGISLAAAVVTSDASPATNPLLAAALPAERRWTFAGTVEEAVPAGPYTYLRITSAGTERWVVTLSAARGEVEVTVLGRAADFTSRRLGRTFPELLFAHVTPKSPESHP